MARPRFHLLTTAGLAWWLHRRWGIPAILGALGGGVLVDGDHLVDYAWTRLRDARTHYVAPFHGWELVILVIVLATVASRRTAAAHLLPDRLGHPSHAWLDQRPVAGALVGLATGLWLHLIHDIVSNRPRHPMVYSLLYRLKHRFRREATGWEEHAGFHNWSGLPWYRWF